MLRIGGSTRRVYRYSLYSFTISIGLQLYNIIKIEKNEEKLKVRKRVMVQQPWSHYLTTSDQTTSCQEQSPVHLNAHCLSTRRPLGQWTGGHMNEIPAPTHQSW